MAVVGSKQIISFFFFTVFGFVIFSIVLVTWGEPVWELALSITDALSVCLRLLFILLFNSFSLHDSLLISLRCLIKRLLSFPLILLFLFIYMFDWKLFVLPWIQITCTAAAANSQTSAVLQNPSGEESKKKKKFMYTTPPPSPSFMQSIHFKS